MFINNGMESSTLSIETIKKIEEKYQATYVTDLAIKTKSNHWGESPAAIFWNEHPKEGHSHYFGFVWQFDVYSNTEKLYVCNCDSSLDFNKDPVVGIIADDGEVIFSRYRHDYRVSNDGSVMIDGGRDYLRCTANKQLVSINFLNGKLQCSPFEFKPEESNKNKLK